MDEALGEANQRLERATKVEKSLAEDKGKLETEVERLQAEVLKAKNIDVAEFKESEAYRSSLTSIAATFLYKEKVKMERLLWRHHHIEDLSCLAHVIDEPTFFESNADEAQEEEEEVTQSDPQGCQPFV